MSDGSESDPANVVWFSGEQLQFAPAPTTATSATDAADGGVVGAEAGNPNVVIEMGPESLPPLHAQSFVVFINGATTDDPFA